MIFKKYQLFFTWVLSLYSILKAPHLYANEILIDPKPVVSIVNTGSNYSLINSVDFHPKEGLFCATYTHNNKVVLYKYETASNPEMVQILSNPLANLSEPQHAVFSPDGNRIVVANWTNQTLTVYRREGDLFCAMPVAIIPSPPELARHKPHGVSFSPCGNFLAIAYGAASYYDRAIGIFHMTNGGIGCKLASLLQNEELPGIPKGITFSPNGNCLLVTFSDTNSLVIYDFDKKNQTILPIPRQTIQGQETKLSRPEDVKIAPDGSYCAVSNSDLHTVTFYPFDKISNKLLQGKPIKILQNPEAQLCFPHGLAFSNEGSFLLITEFGPINTTKDGDIAWNASIQPDQAKINLYRIGPMVNKN